MEENQNPMEELNDLSPFLAELKKQKTVPIFKTPLFYFDTLQDKVFEKLDDNPTIVVTKTSTWAERLQQWFWQPNFIWALSATTILAIAGTFWFQYQSKNAPTIPTLANQEEVHQYITANLDDFEDELLAEYHDLQENKDFKLNLTTEELEHYLNEVSD
jgi:hypothetical protein